METLEQQFNSRVRVFLGRTGVSPTTFGMKALGDPNLMRQLDGGRSLSLRTADRVLAAVSGKTSYLGLSEKPWCNDGRRNLPVGKVLFDLLIMTA